jgi:hypothetical protein
MGMYLVHNSEYIINSHHPHSYFFLFELWLFAAVSTRGWFKGTLHPIRKRAGRGDTVLLGLANKSRRKKILQ